MGLLKTISKVVGTVKETASDIAEKTGIDDVVEKAVDYVEETVDEVKEAISDDTDNKSN